MSIHDVGAGGLSNALPELVNDAGAARASSCATSRATSRGMSPLEIWCNEAQERYVLAVAPERLAAFEALCARERCPFAVVGDATADGQLVVERRARSSEPTPIDMPLEVLLGKPPRMPAQATRAGAPR